MQITISQLKKAFNDNMAVNIDSLHVNDGEIIGLVGNNGAGKTTMFRLMLDLLKADNGYVELTFCTNANEQTQGTGDAADTITVNPAKMEDWKRYTGAYIDDSFLIDFLLPEEYFEFIAKVCGSVLTRWSVSWAARLWARRSSYATIRQETSKR